MQDITGGGSMVSRDSSFSNQLYSLVFDGTESRKREHAYERVVGQYKKWWARQVAAHHARVGTFSLLDWLGVFLPCVGWLRRYKVKESLYGDIAAGLSIGIMVVPQGMSYALLAGLPPVFGLYGAFVPVLVYAVFGSSPQLAVGPVAITSLLLGNGLDDIVKGSDAISDPTDPGSPELESLQDEYNQCAIQVAFIVSILYTLVGVFRLGFLANFLSHSVISGFTTGAAIIIGLSQLKYFFGVKTPNTNTAIETIRELSKVIDKSQWREMVMFAVWLTILLVIKKVAKSSKKLSWIRSIGPISVCLLGIVFVAAMNLDDGKVKVVKNIPSGLPPVTISAWSPLFRGETNFGKQITLAIIVMLVDFMESISIAKALARRGKYKIAVTQEIIGLGLANFAGSMFSAYTTTGSFSRSAVSADIGSKTGLFGVICGLLVMFILLVLTPLFELVPYNAMGAIVVSACVGLFEASEAVFLYRANFLDFVVWIAAFLGTVLAGVEIGLAIAIGLALLLVVYQSAFPHTAVLGRLPGTNVYRSVEQYPSAIMQKGMLIMRIDAPVYFANVQWFRSRLSDYLRSARANSDLAPIQFVILDLSPVPFIDATGMHAFMELVEELKDEGLQLVLANPCIKVKEHLARIHVLEAIGKDWVFVRTSNAVEVCSRAVLDNCMAKTVEDVKMDSNTSSENIAANDKPSPRHPNAVDGNEQALPIHWAEGDLQ